MDKRESIDKLTETILVSRTLSLKLRQELASEWQRENAEALSKSELEASMAEFRQRMPTTPDFSAAKDISSLRALAMDHVASRLRAHSDQPTNLVQLPEEIMSSLRDIERALDTALQASINLRRTLTDQGGG